MKKIGKRINYFINNYRINRKHKDVLFKRAFANKEDLLDLYNALNDTDYKNADELIITTLEDAIYMSMKNDVSFIVASSMNLYEHQSTMNPNMPVRGLLYFAKLYEAYIRINHLDIYGKKLVRLPIPQYIIFYNGTETQPDEVIYKLSDAFETNNTNMMPDLECTARVLNINIGHNNKLLDTCKRLNDYSFFIEQIRIYMNKGMKLEFAIDHAMDSCIDAGVLVDILEKQRSEVKSMLLFTYDEKLHRKNEKRIAQEEGRAEGRAEGRVEGRREEIFDSVYEGDYAPERGAQKLGMDIESFNELFEQWKLDKKIN